MAQSDIAIVLFDSASRTAIDGKRLRRQPAAAALVGRRTDTVVDGNYWSDND